MLNTIDVTMVTSEADTYSVHRRLHSSRHYSVNDAEIYISGFAPWTFCQTFLTIQIFTSKQICLFVPTDQPQQHVCNKEEVQTDPEICNQEHPSLLHIYWNPHMKLNTISIWSSELSMKLAHHGWTKINAGSLRKILVIPIEPYLVWDAEQTITRSDLERWYNNSRSSM